jgi:hypothetical protein
VKKQGHSVERALVRLAVVLVEDGYTTFTTSSDSVRDLIIPLAICQTPVKRIQGRNHARDGREVGDRLSQENMEKPLEPGKSAS